MMENTTKAYEEKCMDQKKKKIKHILAVNDVFTLNTF